MTDRGFDKDFDVVIVGAGLLGCFTARNLARYQLRVAVLERETDLCMGISRANSAIIYSGADTKPGTLKTRLTVEGNRDFERLCAELSVPCVCCGSLMVAYGSQAKRVLEQKYEQGQRNGVEGLRLLKAKEALQLEPSLDPAICQALYAPSTKTVNPWELCIAAAENAQANGVEFFFEKDVMGIRSRTGDGSLGSRTGDGALSCLVPKQDKAPSPVLLPPVPQHASLGFRLTCRDGSSFLARAVVNCAGLGAAAISEMVAPVSFRFKPTRADYLILDEKVEGFINHIIFHEPESKGKGGTFVPTVEGTIMVGPSEEPVDVSSYDSINVPSAFSTTAEGLRFNTNRAQQILPDLPLDQVIRSFSTMRPNIYWAAADAKGTVTISDESISTFHIAAATGLEGFINVAGIKTPGLTCANGIGRHVTELLLPVLGRECLVLENPDFSPIRPAPPRLAQNLKNGRLKEQLLPSNNEDDYEIICRCNRITAAEVRLAIRRPLGARTVDGVKRRTGSCMGRCQGGFCTERIISLLAEELDCSPQQVIKDHNGSLLLKEQDGSWLLKDHHGSLLLKDRAWDTAQSDPVALPGTATGDGLPSTAIGDSALPGIGVRDAALPGTAIGDSALPGTGVRNGTLQSTGTKESIVRNSKPRLLIIGGGAAGMAAAIAASQAGVLPEEILLVERHDYLGGILPQCLHAGFGVRQQETELDGPAYIAPVIRRFQDLHIPCLLRTSVLQIDSEGLITLALPQGIRQLRAEVVILATGCRERTLGSLPVAGTRPAGIMTAGSAQKIVNVNNWDIGRRVVVLGSGDVGLIMAGRFAALNKEVVAVIEQSDRCGGLHRNRVRYLDAYNIPLLLQSTITEIVGDVRIEKVRLTTCLPDGSEQQRWIECDTLITSLGLLPELDLLPKEPSPVPAAQQTRFDPQIKILTAGNARQIRNFIEDVLDDGSKVGETAAQWLQSKADA